MSRAKQPQHPDYNMLLQSAICKLQTTYREYVKAINNCYKYTGFSNDGTYFVLAGQEERNEKAQKLQAEVQDCIRMVEDIKFKLKSQEVTA